MSVNYETFSVTTLKTVNSLPASLLPILQLGILGTPNQANSQCTEVSCDFCASHCVGVPYIYKKNVTFQNENLLYIDSNLLATAF